MVTAKRGENLKTATILKRQEIKRNDGEKDLILKGLEALLLTTTLRNARTYIERAIAYVEQK